MIYHPISPVWNERSKVLILGSFPSVKSRNELFFYAHSQNRFWKVLSRLCGVAEFSCVEEKKAFLLDRGIALWDVIACCEIEGSSDSSIRNAMPNDLSDIILNSDVKAVFTNGKTAWKLYNRYQLPRTHIESICLPSTSSANAAFSLERLVCEWSCILDYTN